jgi:hypothetical protein
MLKQFLFFVLEQTRIENCSEGEQQVLALVFFTAVMAFVASVCFFITVLMQYLSRCCIWL